MEYISSWFMLMMSIYWVKTQIPRKNKEALLQTNKEVGLEVNTEKIKYMFLPHHQKAGQSLFNIS